MRTAVPRASIACARLALLALFLVSAVQACAVGRGDVKQPETTLARRSVTGRLARPEAWAPCRAVDTVSVVFQFDCSGGTPPSDREAPPNIVQAGSVAGASDSPATLHDRAIADLPWIGASEASARRIAAQLERAAARAPRDAALHNDLGVAYLALAERDQSLVTMLRALDAVERALASDSSLRVAQFNRALILERLYMTSRARRAWIHVLGREVSADWRAEALAHLRALPATREAEPWSTVFNSLSRLGTPSAESMGRAVDASRQASRDFGFTLLGRWGAAAIANDDARADAILRLARALGSALASADGDASIALAVRGIDSSSTNHAVRHEMATAFVDLARGTDSFGHLDYSAATRSLSGAARILASLHSPAAGWAEFYLGAARVSHGDYRAGDSVFHHILRVAPQEASALIGKTKMALGVSQVRRGNYESATTWYESARAPILRSREMLTLGHLDQLLSESNHRSGQMAASNRNAYRALRLLATYQGSNYRTNQLSHIADDARQLGLRLAALKIQEELLDAARRAHQADVLALGFGARARALAEMDQPAEADAALKEAEYWTRRMPVSRGLERIRASLLLTRGEVLRKMNPAAALPLLKAAADVFQSFESDLFLPEALHEVSQAMLALGDSANARDYLDLAVHHLERQERGFRSGEYRATFAETAERVFDAAIGLADATGHNVAAFDYMERGRQLAWLADSDATRWTSGGAANATVLSRRLPQGTLLVEFAVLSDRLLVWTISRAGVARHSTAVSRDSLAALVLRVSNGSPSIGDGGALESLFDLLLRPISAQLDSAPVVIMVPDRELFSVPFAALRDRQSGRYAVERSEIRMAPSAAFYFGALSVRAVGRVWDNALVVGAPASMGIRYPEFPPLPGAEREARSVATLYPRTRLITGASSSRVSVVSALPHASVFHFAGHAVFDVEQPGRSFLVLASPSDTAEWALFGRDIAGLRLSNLRLVVLSACSTLNPHASHMGSVAGLAHSFLRAGVTAIVSTLWDIEDDTATELLVDFHRELAAGASASAALRSAQLHAITSHSTRSSPHAWAAFTYTGP